MQKGSSGGAKLNAVALQHSLSTFLSGRLALVVSRASARRRRKDKMALKKKPHKVHANLIDERRVAFDLIDGHFE